MGPQDGVDYALRSLAALRDARPDDWHAAFVGGGDCFDEMRALARELGLDDHVTFTGRIPDEELLGILSTADVALVAGSLQRAERRLDDEQGPRVHGGRAADRVVRPARGARLGRRRRALRHVQRHGCVRRGRVRSARRSRGATTQGEAGRERIAGPLSWEHSKTQLLASYAACEGAVGVIEDVGPFARAAPV